MGQGKFQMQNEILIFIILSGIFSFNYFKGKNNNTCPSFIQTNKQKAEALLHKTMLQRKACKMTDIDFPTLNNINNKKFKTGLT
jgi:hypothetical protein